ncbi:hypothetical protein [Longispora albida]|uniref:hypothetical protein n=1 Tax=Longispora albida TaxID=203523 RepID=UPI0003670C5B|nr:hypothetical protein [Longispora albida]
MALSTRQTGLLETARLYEQALAGQAPAARLGVLLGEVRRALAGHDDLGELLDAAPHLARRLRALATEHARLQRQLDSLTVRLAQGVGKRFAKDSAELLRGLRVHQRRGAELLHAAYTLDLGGET